MERGFTLIEVMVVVFVLIILAIVTIPRLMSIGEVRLHMAVRKVAQDLRYAHEYAVINNVYTMVTFDTAADTYTLTYCTHVGIGWDMMTDPTTGEDFVVQLNSGEYKGVAISDVNFDDSFSIEFDAMGIPYAHGEAVPLVARGKVELRTSLGGTGARTSNVYVDPDTGRVYLRGCYYYVFP